MDYLVRQYKISERRACNLMEQHRSTQRYAAMSSDQDPSVFMTTGDMDDEEWIPVDDERVEPAATAPSWPSSQFTSEIAWPSEIPAARSTGPRRQDPGPGAPGSAVRHTGAGGAVGAGGVVHNTVMLPFRIVGGVTRRTVGTGSSYMAGACSAADRIVRLLPPPSRRLVHRFCPCRHSRHV